MRTLLLTRIGFQIEGDLPEYVLQYVYIDKFGTSISKALIDNDNIEVIESKAGRCDFKYLKIHY